MTQLEMKIGLEASQAFPMVRKIGMMDLKDARVGSWSLVDACI